jgi:hypothetical protein
MAEGMEEEEVEVEEEEEEEEEEEAAAEEEACDTQLQVWFPKLQDNSSIRRVEMLALNRLQHMVPWVVAVQVTTSVVVEFMLNLPFPCPMHHTVWEDQWLRKALGLLQVMDTPVCHGQAMERVQVLPLRRLVEEVCFALEFFQRYKIANCLRTSPQHQFWSFGAI